MIQLLDNQIMINAVHKEIMGKTYANMCSRLNGLNLISVKLVDTDSQNIQIDEGDGEDKGIYLIHIRFSDSFSGFLYNLIDALGFIIGGNEWMSQLRGSPTKADIWFSIYNELSLKVKEVF